MRGKVAKRLRKKVYGDGAKRGTKYARNTRTGMIVTRDKRALYKKEKKAYKGK